ncbi:MAG: hypothetical protein OEZ06_29760 [Myxococcales bacterium]|nr:hypothetical protein [Myxococcales bacterium]
MRPVSTQSSPRASDARSIAALALLLCAASSAPAAAQSLSQVPMLDDVELSVEASGDAAPLEDTASEGDAPGGHPTDGKYSLGLRLGWTQRAFGSPGLDPFETFGASDADATPAVGADPSTPTGSIVTPTTVQTNFKMAERQGDVPQVDPFDLTLAVRGGYTLPESHLYLGGVVGYFGGGERTLAPLTVDGVEVLTETVTSKANFITAGVELGIDAAVSSNFVLRPVMGLGLALSQAELCIGSDCREKSDQNGYLTPGFDGMFFIGPVHVTARIAWLGVQGVSRMVGFESTLGAGVTL